MCTSLTNFIILLFTTSLWFSPVHIDNAALVQKKKRKKERFPFLVLTIIVILLALMLVLYV